jgi:CheY-like chemotaxis protein
VLLVEDENELRKLTAELLIGLGYRVLEASRAEEALELARLHPGRIHALLTDVVMPGQSGPELARRLRAERPETRVLFASGYASDALGARRTLEPGVRLLNKPWTETELAIALRAALDR